MKKILTKKNIMIVEDDIIIALSLRKTLIKVGYNICCIISNGKDVISQIEDNKPDLIIIDILLDGKINGIQTVKKIQKLFNIPIIYLTANTDKKIRAIANKTAMHEHIVKPYSNNILMETINSVLKRHNNKYLHEIAN